MAPTALQFRLLALSLSIIAIASWAIFYSLGLTNVYNDAMSHLNVARLVVDNIQPGLSQLGSVWLPLSHLLILPFVTNDFLWHTGLAGAIISMAAFVVSGLSIYKIVTILSSSRLAALLATVAFVLNLNMLYLQTTALTEPLYLGIFTLSILMLVIYLKNGSLRPLIALSGLCLLGVLTRYDAWFVAVVIAIIIAVNEFVVLRKNLKATLGQLLLFGLPIIFGVALWLGWNLIIFGDPLYSFVGPYSARAQQSLIESASGLITKNNIGMSSWAYLLTTVRNIGLIVMVLGVIGWLLYIIFNKTHTLYLRLSTFTALFSIILFNVIALFLGFSILNLPELGWNPSGTKAGELFNVRYGVLALPLIAVGVGLLLAQVPKLPRTTFAVLCLVLVGQMGLIYRQGVITLQDGQQGSSGFVNQDVAAQLKQRVKAGDTVIMSTSSYNAVAFESGLALKTFIHEGVSEQWNAAIARPEGYAKWIIMANNDIGEAVHTSLVEKQNSAFLKNYSLVFKGAYASLYQRHD